LASPPPAGTISRPSSEGSWPSALTIFSRAFSRFDCGRWSPKRSIARDQRLRLQRQQARRAGEVVAVGLRVDLDLVAEDFRVEDVGAAAEVDDVQQLDVLAQLILGQLQPFAQVGDLQAFGRFRRFDQHPGEGDQAGEALRPDRRVAAAVGARAAGASRSGRSTTLAGLKPLLWRSRSVAIRASASSRRSSGASTWRSGASAARRRSARGARRSRFRRSCPCPAPCRRPSPRAARRRCRSRARSARRSARGSRSSPGPGSPPAASRRGCRSRGGTKSSGGEKSCSALVA